MKKKYAIKDNGDVMFYMNLTNEEAAEMEKVQKMLWDSKFKLLGFDASEGLFQTGAWREDNKYVYCLVDSEPFDDKMSGIIHPDPFNCPTNRGKDVQVLVYQKPFKPSEDDGEEWVMDGIAPVQVHEDNQQIMSPIFQSLKEALEFCDFLTAHEAKHTLMGYVDEVEHK